MHMLLKTLMIFLAIILQGCCCIPRDEILSGKPIDNSEQHIVPGVTTRAEVLERFHEPDVAFGDLRVIGYKWEKLDYKIYWALGSYTGGAAGIANIGTRYVMFVTFNNYDKVLRYETIKCDNNIIIGTMRNCAIKWMIKNDPTIY